MSEAAYSQKAVASNIEKWRFPVGDVYVSPASSHQITLRKSIEGMSRSSDCTIFEMRRARFEVARFLDSRDFSSSKKSQFSTSINTCIQYIRCIAIGRGTRWSYSARGKARTRVKEKDVER